MAKIEKSVKIVILGTKNSQILDKDENYVVEFNQGDEMQDGINNSSELISNAIMMAQIRGDALISIEIEGKDFVHDFVYRKLIENKLNQEITFHEMCLTPFLAHADPSDIWDLLQEVINKTMPM